jgi:hypothetical protein
VRGAGCGGWSLRQRCATRWAAVSGRSGPWERVSRRVVRDRPEEEGVAGVARDGLGDPLYLWARGGLRTWLEVVLGSGRTRRVGRSGASVVCAGIRGVVDVSDRPVVVEDRS